MRTPLATIVAAATMVVLVAAGCAQGNSEQDAAIRQHVLRAREQIAAGRTRDAIASFEAALAVQEQLATLLALAQLHATLAEWNEAEGYLERARTRAPLDARVQLGLVDVAVGRRDLERARTLVQGLVQRTPMEPTPRLILGALSRSAEQAQSASAELSAWRNRVKGFQETLELGVVESELALSLGNIRQARSLLESARGRSPGEGALCARLARIYLSRRRWIPAEVLLGAAARKVGVTRSLWLQLAGAALEAGHYREAEASLGRAEATNPARNEALAPAVVILRARVELGLGKAQQAHDRLAAALRPGATKGAATTGDEKLKYWLARSLAAMERLDEASSLFESIAAPTGIRCAAQLALARLNLKRKETARARQRLEALTREGSDAPAPAYLLLAKLTRGAGEDQAAERTLREGLSHHPSSGALWVALARILQQSRRNQRATEALDHALEVEPFNIEALGLKAAAAERARQPGQAARFYERILDIRPGFPAALNNLAFAYAEAGKNLDRSLELAEQARAATPDDPLVADTLAWVRHKRGEHGLALALIEEALQKQPGHPQLLYHQGAILLALGKTQAGRNSLAKALEHGSDFAGAMEARQLLSAR